MEKVRALRDFDAEAWRSGIHNEEVQDTRQLVEQVFRDDDNGGLKLYAEIEAPVGVDNWWESINGDSIDLSPESGGKSKPEKSKSNLSGVPVAEESPQEDDNDFQVQATPPHLRSIPRHVVSTVIDDDSTDDEDNLDAPSQHTKILDSVPSSPPKAKSPQKAKKLGTLGGAKKETPKLVPADDDDTTTDDEPILPPKRHEKSPTLTPTPKKISSLGKIGGKRAPSPPPKEPATPPKKASPSPEKPKRKGKLGQLGGKKKEATPPPAADTSSGTEDTSPKPTPAKIKLGHLGGAKAKTEEPKKEEKKIEEMKEDTSPEAKADKKRLLLKKELEAKAQAGPSKKKRKF